MKKLGILLLLFSMFSFVGCGGQEGSGNGGSSDIVDDSTVDQSIPQTEDPAADPGAAIPADPTTQ